MAPGIDRWLHWLAPLLAVAAVAMLPALQARVPFAPPAEWTIGQLGMELVRQTSQGTGDNNQRPNFREMLRQARQWQQEFGGRTSSRQQRGVETGLALAGLIPVAALVAGLAAILCLLLAVARLRKLEIAAAIAGVGASAYAVGASLWLTRVAQAAARAGVSSAESKLGQIFGGLHLPGLAAAVEQLGVRPEAGLYVVLLALLAVLVIPARRAVKAA